MATSYEFRILGPIGLGYDGEAVPVGPPKRKAVVTALLLETNQPVPISQLVPAVWPKPAPRSAVANLRSHVFELRRVLGSRLVAHPQAYQLRVEDGELDADRFVRLVRAGRQALAAADPATALLRLGRALSLWRGTAGDGLSRGTRLEARLASLNEQRLDVFEDYAQARLSTGEFVQIATDLRQHLAAWPVRERGWELLMLTLYRSGNAPGALAAYQQARAALAEQLGIEPGRRLQRLHRSILNRDPALEPRPPQELVAVASPPPPAAPQPTAGLPAGPVPPPLAVSPVGSVPRQLPPAEAELVGRDDERAALVAALRGNPQAVVLTGPAGVGKSTLALHAAHTVAAEYPDGHLVLDLDRTGAAPPDPAQVLAAVLRALTGTPLEPWTGPDPGTLGELSETYRSVASHRRALILLDGAADAEQVRPLLTGPSGCTLLITSRRRRLPLPQPPHHLQVPPLPTREAVALLTRYAGSVRAGTEPEAVEELARRCHGLPLALRIAGGWLARRPELPARLLATHLARRPLDGLSIGRLSVRAALAADLRAVTAEDPLAEPVFRLLGRTDGATTPEELAGPAGTDPSRVFFTLERLLDRWLVDSPEPGQYRVTGLPRAYAAELASGDS